MMDDIFLARQNATLQPFQITDVQFIVTITHCLLGRMLVFIVEISVVNEFLS